MTTARERPRVWDYLSARGIAIFAEEPNAFGILAELTRYARLPATVPTFDEADGWPAQARFAGNPPASRPKVVSYPGRPLKGSALRIVPLVSRWQRKPAVAFVAEGLTDFLAAAVPCQRSPCLALPA